MLNKLFNFRRKDTQAQRMDRLTEDGELPGGWVYQNREYLKPLEETNNVLLQQVLDKRHDAPQRLLSALKLYADFLRVTQKQCELKGECFRFWYNEIMTSNGNPAFVEQYEYYRDNIDALEKEYARKKQIQKEILEIVRANPSILQTTVYKSFDADERGIVSNEIYQFAAHGIITRTKSGRTYSLTLE